MPDDLRDPFAMRPHPWPMTCRGRRLSPRGEPGLVSVVVPTCNRASMLPEAMDSVRAQTYRPIELVVVDDGSTDDTHRVVEEWGGRHGRSDFRLVYRFQENRGLPGARNAGALLARGAYLQFLDSDDHLHPQRFERILRAGASEADFDLAVTGYAFVWDDGRPPWVRPPMNFAGADPVAECIRRPLWAASPLYTRSFFRRVGFFNEALRYGEDWEFGIRVAVRLRPGRCLLLDEPLAFYRMHPGPRIVTDERRPEEILDLFGTAEAALRCAGLHERYGELLAAGLVTWYGRHGRWAYLGRALGMHCSAALKGKIMLLGLLATLAPGPALVRAWRERVAGRIPSLRRNPPGGNSPQNPWSTE